MGDLILDLATAALGAFCGVQAAAMAFVMWRMWTGEYCRHGQPRDVCPCREKPDA